jgi:hypothetical protein
MVNLHKSIDAVMLFVCILPFVNFTRKHLETVVQENSPQGSRGEEGNVS